MTGLPRPQQDHAVRMTRFARDCVAMSRAVFNGLEQTLGPDTGDLQVKIGLHSGQVTAGIMGGDKSRFQLFGM